ncbi:AfsR/SARP family transcriptional regulator [Streptomyces rubellomurinus]|nr:AfsR/SARP family transcriptional regulator [Streptomyces rubellomurinus]
MDISILGPLLIGDDQRTVRLRAKKNRVMLTMLALNAGRVVAFDELIDELWGEAPLKNARNALQATVKRMRKSLAELGLERHDRELVRTVDNGYLLDVPEGAVDAYRFLRTAERGAGLVEHRPYEAMGTLREALAMWRGPALLDTSDGPWCRAVALRLDEQRRTAREDLIAAQLQAGEAGAVVPELKQLLAQHPERERFSEQLMIALYRCGRPSEAVDTFHRTRRWLDEELGLAPSRRLHHLYQAILVQDPSL